MCEWLLFQRVYSRENVPGLFNQRFLLRSTLCPAPASLFSTEWLPSACNVENETQPLNQTSSDFKLSLSS